MKVTFQIRYEDQQPAAGVLIRLVAPVRAGTATDVLSQGQVIAEGQTSANGQWQYENDEVRGTQRLALLVLDADSGEVLHQTRPTIARRIPDRVELTIARTPAEIPAPSPDGPDWPGGDVTPQPQPAGTPRRSYTDILAERLAQEERVRRAEGEVVGNRVHHGFTRRRAGREFAEKFLGQKPLGKKRVPHFIPTQHDPSERLDRVIREGVERIGQAAINGQSGITVRPGSVANMLPEPGGTVSPDRFDQLLPLIMPGNQAKAKASPLELCQMRKQAEAEIEEMASEDGSEVESDPDPDQPDPPALASASDASQIDALIEKMNEPAVTGARPTVTEVASSLGTEVPSGPADATSYYDFHNLQIAWEDTWTGLVDSGMVSQVKELYDSLVSTMPDEVNLEALTEELGEVAELHELLDTLQDAAAAMGSSILTDSQLSAWIPEIADKWHDLTPYERDKLGFLYDVHIYVSENHTLESPGVSLPNTIPLSQLDKFKNYPSDWLPTDLTVYGAYISDWSETEANEILQGVTESTGARIGRVDELISDLKTEIAQPYQFDVFVADSYNYGLLTTYRQEWQPVTYQPGDLAGTIALAPNETRRYRISRKVRRSSSSTRTTSSLDAQNLEIENSARSEGEIMRRTQSSLNASTSAQLGFELGITFSGGGDFGFDQSMESSQTKSDIRESTRSNAQEFRDERKVEVNAEQGFESEMSEEREVTNPNNELTVTYLFYELQRRFQVTERLYDVQPVILVAYDVPAPHLIDEAWLLKQEWILRKVLLDDSLHPVLRTLSQDFAGDELAVEIYEEQWKTQIAIVGELKEQMQGHAALREEARAAIERAAEVARVAAAEAEDNNLLDAVKDVALVATGGVGALVADALFKKVPDASESTEAPVTSPEDSGREALDWADTDLAAAQAALRSGIGALEVATERYIQAVRDRLNRRVRIDKLILHVKSNILHYMQAIWRHEHPDERYMRLYDLEVVWPSWNGVFTYAPSQVPGYQRAAAPPVAGLLNPEPQGKLLPPEISLEVTRKLHQVADLSRLIGFKGNYGIFPLREANALTTTMAVDYLDTEFGVTDPDPFGDIPTAEEAVELAHCAWTHPETTEEDKKDIADWLVETLEQAHSASQEIIVPTGELFIEALPGAHTLLEDFKLQHRAHDAAKASAEARMAELEVLRRGDLLKAAELGDPDIDKRIEIQGTTPSISVDTE